MKIFKHYPKDKNKTFMRTLDNIVTQYARIHIDYGYPNNRVLDKITGIIDFAQETGIIKKTDRSYYRSYAYDTYDYLIGLQRDQQKY